MPLQLVLLPVAVWCVGVSGGTRVQHPGTGSGAVSTTLAGTTDPVPSGHVHAQDDDLPRMEGGSVTCLLGRPTEDGRSFSYVLVGSTYRGWKVVHLCACWVDLPRMEGRSLTCLLGRAQCSQLLSVGNSTFTRADRHTRVHTSHYIPCWWLLPSCTSSVIGRCLTTKIKCYMYSYY